MVPKQERVNRPLRKDEHEIVLATSKAKKGWRDLCATQPNATVKAWEFLTAHPTEQTVSNYKLRGELGTVEHKGKTHDRWQHKLNSGARIWFYVEGKTVALVNCYTKHPNETK